MTIRPFSALVQRYAPEVEKRCRPHLQATTDSWRVDETSGKVKGSRVSLYRAVDAQRKTVKFLLSPTPDADAAKGFFSKALVSSGDGSARVITLEKKAASPNAFHEMKAMGALPVAGEWWQRKSLNNLLEQDHRFIKRLVQPGMGSFSNLTAWRTLQGSEAINRLRKGQMQGGSKGEHLRQATLIAELFGVAL